MCIGLHVVGNMLQYCKPQMKENTIIFLLQIKLLVTCLVTGGIKFYGKQGSRVLLVHVHFPNISQFNWILYICCKRLHMPYLTLAMSHWTLHCEDVVEIEYFHHTFVWNMNKATMLSLLFSPPTPPLMLWVQSAGFHLRKHHPSEHFN